MTDLENRFLRRVGAISSLVYGLGWMLGGICSLAGDKMILSAIHSPATGPVGAGGNLALAWWLEVFANVVFAFSDFGIIIAFAAFGILYRSVCPIYRILCFTIAVWMTIVSVTPSASVRGMPERARLRRGCSRAIWTAPTPRG